MKKGEKIYIDSKIKKEVARQDSWTEKNLYGTETLKAGTKMFHVSENNKLEGFAPVITCFSMEPCLTGYTYMIVLKKDVVCKHYDIPDYRINLGTYRNEYFEIIYIGTVGYNHKSAIIDKFGRVIERFKKFNFAKEYEDVANELAIQNKKHIEKSFLDNYHKGLGYKIVKY